MSRKYYIDDVLSDSGSDEVSLSDLTLARDVFSDLPVDTDCVNSRSVDVLYERSRHRRKQQRNERDEERPREVSRQSGISDFSLSESLSTIPVASEAPEAPRSVKEVYRELHSINEKLRKEFKLLHERDDAVRDKEASLKEKELSLKKTAARIERHIEMETTRKLQAAEELHRLAMEKLEILLKEKIRENKRQRENFDMLKSANDTLHKELDTLQTQHGKLEKQFTSLQARLTNLQRKRNFEENKHSGQQALATLKKQGVVKDTSKAVTARQKTSLHTHQVMAVLLQWIADVHLRQTVTEQPTKSLEGACSQEFIQEKCFRVLPYLVDMLQELPAGSTSPVSLPCLQFTYWSLLHIDLIPGQKGGVTVSLRRLGEELYRPAKQILSGGDNGTQDGMRHRDLTYIQSIDLPVRLVSALIILKTDTQVDHLAYVCGILKTDLKTDNGKELFLYYQATSTILTHVKTSNKLLVNLVTDIYLQMAIESPLLPNFLMSCSNEAWFRSVSLIWRMPSVEVKLLEKMSIILQKLSKMKQNKRYFEVFGISSSCSEMLRTMGNENPFLVLNVKSILFNLSSEKVPSMSLLSSG